MQRNSEKIFAILPLWQMQVILHQKRKSRMKKKLERSVNVRLRFSTLCEIEFFCLILIFRDAIHVDNALQRTEKLTECFHFVNEGKRAKKLLVAMTEPEKFFSANERYN